MAALLFTAALLLSACSIRTVPLPASGGAATAEAAPTPTPEVLYTVRFMTGEETLQEEQLSEGAFSTLPTVPEVYAAFLGWLGESGNAAVPTTGDSANIALWSVLAILSAAGLWALRRRGFAK